MNDTIEQYPNPLTMISYRVDPQNPPHPGKLIRICMEDVGWSASETARRLGCDRSNLSRLLRCRIGLSVNMALLLENIGWGSADYWIQIQVAYKIVQSRKRE